MPTLATTVDGLKLPNPFVIASGPPGTNLNVIMRAFREGWGAVIAKTISLDSSKVINVTPRYAKLVAADGKDVVGWENIELISDRKFDIWLDEFKKCKDQHPDGVLIASIMEEYDRDAWTEIVERCQDAGVDGFELNFSCPHGLPERKMGAAMGENPEILEEVSGLGENDAERNTYRRSEPRGIARRMSGRERDQHDSQRDWRELGNTAARAGGRRVYHPWRLLVQSSPSHRAANVHGDRSAHPRRVSRPLALRHRRH
jgi:dihydropyrimidine dehydrogenase (NADP+)/dihydropyrimidine dehydrogenase (NAD+) subunit PreA